MSISLTIRLCQVTGGWKVQCGDWISALLDREAALQTAKDMAAIIRRMGDQVEIEFAE